MVNRIVAGDGIVYIHYCETTNGFTDIPPSGFFLKPGEKCWYCGAVMPKEDSDDDGE